MPQKKSTQASNTRSLFLGRPRTNVVYQTTLGRMVNGTAEEVLESSPELWGRVQLIFTSPPFPLNHKKKYGNLQGDAYIRWLKDFALIFTKLLTPDGSIVIELGNAWTPGRPVMDMLALRSLIAFQEVGKLNLCQEFICHNPARLPSPAQWVNVERIRLKDSYTRLWWLSPVDRPKADNRRVLQPYSRAMEKLLESKKYNAGKRPSQHRIGKTSFLANHGGSIPPNVLSISNTRSIDQYQDYCRKNRLHLHPARMPRELASFFIRFLTEENDLVLDPFAGSNTTGHQAEVLKRRWLSIEADKTYIKGSVGRFGEKGMTMRRRQ